jgi:hypothetical protein|mmetsp:Transcript_93836/g.148229  ORF Transcript_93836/g.148229 Transcript_93836/m.148229 type:complete len:297 (-) Transcript_93836:356-1246(-)
MFASGKAPLVNSDSAKCTVDTSDLSTDCSDSTSHIVDCHEITELDSDCTIELGSDVEVHAEIDEEDDDLFFSTHKRPSATASSTIEEATTDDHSISYIVHAEIDEDDDDVFFSTHKGTPSCIPKESVPKLQDSRDSTIVHADIDEDDDDVFFSTHKKISEYDVRFHQLSVANRKQALVSQDDYQKIEDQELLELPQMVVSSDIVNVAIASSAPQNERQKINCQECAKVQSTAVGCEIATSTSQLDQTISARGRDSIGSVGSDDTCNRLKFLDDLRGARSGGVRKHLERKLTQEADT